MQLTNNKMNNLLEKISNSKYIDKSLKINLQDMQEIMWPKFYEKNGCIFVNKCSLFYEYDVKIKLSKLEADSNEFPIDGYLEIKKNTPKLEVIKFGLMVVEMWGCKLKNEFPNSKFHIIFSFDGKYSKIRFYKVREDEYSDFIRVDLKELDSYEDAILLKEF